MAATGPRGSDLAMKGGGYYSLSTRGAKDVIDAVTPLVIEVMEAAFVLDAPLVADAKVGQNWLEMG